MIDFYYWTTPNAHKITLFLEEAGLEYQIKPVNISVGEQFDYDFLKISPNNRIPAIVDQNPKDGSAPISLFESGAILLYLADKTKKFIGTSETERAECLQWLFWQMGGLGPMAGQNHHFNQYAPEQIPYAITRYVNETNRLYGVIDKRLADREFVTGAAYTIADMAIYPWIVPHERQKQNLDDFPALKSWFEKSKRDRPLFVLIKKVKRSIRSRQLKMKRLESFYSGKPPAISERTKLERFNRTVLPRPQSLSRFSGSQR